MKGYMVYYYSSLRKDDPSESLVRDIVRKGKYDPHWEDLTYSVCRRDVRSWLEPEDYLFFNTCFDRTDDQIYYINGFLKAKTKKYIQLHKKKGDDWILIRQKSYSRKSQADWEKEFSEGNYYISYGWKMSEDSIFLPKNEALTSSNHPPEFASYFEKLIACPRRWYKLEEEDIRKLLPFFVKKSHLNCCKELGKKAKELMNKFRQKPKKSCDNGCCN